MARSRRLSEKSATVLRHIAEGRSYGQIVEASPDLTYLDIFHAAEEALEVIESLPDHDERMAKIKNKHPRAYERWSEEEEGDLRSLYGEGATTADIAAHLGRQPSAIRSRLRRLGLDEDSVEADTE